MMEGVIPVRLITVTDTADGTMDAVIITAVSEAETRVAEDWIEDIVKTRR